MRSGERKAHKDAASYMAAQRPSSLGRRPGKANAVRSMIPGHQELCWCGPGVALGRTARHALPANRLVVSFAAKRLGPARAVGLAQPCSSYLPPRSLNARTAGRRAERLGRFPSSRPGSQATPRTRPRLVALSAMAPKPFFGPGNGALTGRHRACRRAPGGPGRRAGRR